MSSSNTLLRFVPVTLRVMVGLALMIGALLAAHSWLAEHDAATALRVTLATQAKVLQQADISQKDRDASLAKTLATITSAKSAVNTAAQAAAQIPQILPPLPDPEPIHIELPPAQPPQSPGEPESDGPPPAAVATVPQADLKPLYDYLQDCRACQSQLAAAKGDLDDERRKTTALTAQRDAAVRAAHGTFWSRLSHSAKWALIGGAVVALAAAASKK